MNVKRIIDILGQVAICVLVLGIAIAILYFSNTFGPFLSGPGVQP